MATLKLSELLNKQKGVDLVFVDLMPEETRDGSTIVRLFLKDTIPTVYGRKITDNTTGDTVPLLAVDVMIVSLGVEALTEIEKYEEEQLKLPEADRKPIITWDVEGKSGHLKCDFLKFDVSTSLDVWVVKTSLRVWGQQQQVTRRQRQTSNLVARVRQAATRKEFADTDVNAAAGAPETAGEGKPKPEAVSN